MSSTARQRLALTSGATVAFRTTRQTSSCAQAAVVPAVIGLAVTPLLLYKLLPPEVQQTPEAPAQAAKKLEEMGSMSRNESIMLGTMCFALVLWVRAVESRSD